MEPPTQAWQEAAGSPAGDPPTRSTIEALLSAVTGIAQGMDDIRSEMTDVRQQLSDIRQMQAGPDRPSQQPEPELRPAESQPQQDSNGTGNQFPPDGRPRRAPATMNRGCKPTFEEVLQGTDAVPADMESDDNKWQDKYNYFQSQIATHNIFIHIQWEQKLETLTTFLAHCEDRQAIEARRGRLGAKLQVYHDVIEGVWQMKPSMNVWSPEHSAQNRQAPVLSTEGWENTPTQIHETRSSPRVMVLPCPRAPHISSAIEGQTTRTEHEPGPLIPRLERNTQVSCPCANLRQQVSETGQTN